MTDHIGADLGDPCIHCGIRVSNISKYPDDGSEKCLEREAAFEFAKAAVMRMAAAGEARARELRTK